MTVAYTTVNGTATAGSDYTTTSGTVTFLAGQTTATVTVPVLDDSVFENPEAFTVTLGAVTGGVTVADGSGTGNIADNDALAGQTVRVSEEGLPGANPDSTGATDTTNSPTVGGIFDVSGVISPIVTLTAPASYTSGGVPITWVLSNSGHTLTGTAGSATIVVVSITNGGAYTVTLSGPIDHAAPPAGTSVENTINLGIGVSVSSSGNLIGSSTLTVTVEDDSPVAAVTPGHFQNSTNTVLNGTLANIGADSTNADVNITGITPPAGGLSSGGVALVYTTSLDGSTITATAGVGGSPVFTMQASNNGTYTFTQSQLLDLSVLTSTLQSSVGAGGPQLAYYLYADGTFGSTENAKDWAVKITGNGNINPSTQGMGVGNNLFQGGETMRFEFDDEGASTFAGNTANLAYVAKTTFQGLDAGEIVGYTVHFTSGPDLVGTATTANTVNGVLTITAPTGLFIDYIDFAPAAGTTVRVTGVSTFVLDDTATKNISFGYNAIDSDGDTISGSVVITAQNSHTLTGTSGNDALAGGSGNDILNGGSGNDILNGGSGNDILNGGSGNDILNGGSGNDTFKFTEAGTMNADTITDFTVANIGAGGDVLDISALLTGATPGTLVSGGFIQITADINGYAVISVDANGGGNSYVPVVTLQGVLVADPATLLATLLSNGQIDPTV